MAEELAEAQRGETVAFQRQTLELIETVNLVLGQYEGPLTLRQVFYRLVAAQVVTNSEKAYKRLSAVLTKARLAGAVDDTRIVDRLRQAHRVPCWADLSAFLQAARRSYRREKWAGQPCYLEVWCEKDAVAGVLQPITEAFEVTLYPCRGYNSYSALREAGQRFRASGKPNVILYLGDFDPSGQDMARDIVDRLRRDFGAQVNLQLLALTSDQVEANQLPPAPAKRQDTRAAAFIAQHGDRAVELDALPPDVLQELVREGIGRYWDKSAFLAEVDQQERDQAQLLALLPTG